MRRTFLLAVPLVFCLLLSSCSNPQQLYEKGNYQGSINKIDRLKNPSTQDYLLKAKNLITLGKENEAKSSLLIFLLSEENPSNADRQFAVRHFLNVNTSDNLAVSVLRETDGLDAQVALYQAYSRKADTANALKILGKLTESLDYASLMKIVLEDPIQDEYVIKLFMNWYDVLAEDEKQVFLEMLNTFSNLRMTETTAKQTLALTDILSADEFYTTDTIKLSLLLKVKGNVLDKLYDKVNARLYWTQAYRLNPEDEDLRKKTE